MGCPKNLVDSEKILGQLNPQKFDLFHDSEKPADIVIINTCGFINDAKEESIETILHNVEAKKQGFVKKVIVTGCLSQRYHEELIKEIPEVDAWFGSDDASKLFEFIKQDYNQDLDNRFVTTPSHYAYLKISEGCDRFCAFCAIPLIRGVYHSFPIEKLVKEAKLLADKGVKELLLVAQDLNYYGYDLENKHLLAPLLEELSKIDGIEWIRLHYAYPQNFPEDVINIMANNPKVCKYIDIPLQHISDRILKEMRRGHGKKEILELLNNFRNKIPDISIRTTMMVGFPGETEVEYNELLEFIKEAKFERLGVFTYSPEEGTTAYSLKDNISEKVKRERADKLMDIQQSISFDNNTSKIGKVFKVLIDREEAEHFVGRTEFDSPEIDNEVLINKATSIKVGEFVNVKITDAAEFELFGEII
jgi:ribosomal protein S12 methylthiotransferase